MYSLAFFNLYDFQQKLQCDHTKASALTSLLSSTFSNCFSHKTNVKTPTLPPHYLLQIAHMQKNGKEFYSGLKAHKNTRLNFNNHQF